jgi:hypothetical protein
MSPYRRTEIGLDFAERRGDMASLAEGPECPCVDVFASVTAKARRTYLDLCLHRSLMARKTIESVMRAIEAKIRAFIVIKVPLTPVPGVVTLFATRTQSPLVLIIFLMARPARHAGIFVGWLLVAILALHIRMFA